MTEAMAFPSQSSGVMVHGTVPVDGYDLDYNLYLVDSQEAVIRFVSQKPGAIGYIERCKLDQRVAVILKNSGYQAFRYKGVFTVKYKRFSMWIGILSDWLSSGVAWQTVQLAL